MPAVHEHTLQNGMTLLCMRQQHLHSIHFGLYLKGGSLYENAQTQGMSHLLEHLCFRGLGGLTHEELNQVQSRMGSELFGATYPEAVVFEMSALPHFFGDLLRLFARFFADRPWTQEQIAQEKQVVLRQIEQAEDGFDDTVERRFRETSRGAFPVMGTAESVGAMSDSAIDRCRRMLFQPQNACLCITGNLTKGMEAAAIAVMSDLKNTTDDPPFAQEVPQGFLHRDEGSDLVVDEEGGQARVHIAFDIDSSQVVPLLGQLLDAITAGNVDSLLFQTLREEEALVAEIESYIEELGAFRRLVIHYDVRQEKLQESLCRVFTLLARLKMYIRPVRLAMMRTQFTENLVMAQDSAAEMNELMGWSWVAEDTSLCDLDAQSRMYDDLTHEDLQDAAQCVLRPSNLTISVQRDPEADDADLAPLFAQLRAMLQ